MVRENKGHHKKFLRLASHNIFISVVIPCLNEGGTIGKCIREAVAGIRNAGETGEVIVVDNGSTDHSVSEVSKIQEQFKFKNRTEIKQITERQKGYGAALLRGFREAKGIVIVMGDADGSYDFKEIPQLVSPILNGGYDLVVGSRLSGQSESGAMPFFHRHVGTPVLTALANRFFRLDLSDSQSGYRAIRTVSYRKLGMRFTGMEFASEMLVRAARVGLAITEVPIRYRRRGGKSKLIPVRDAWRHVRFLLLFSPTWLFTIPGFSLFCFGLIFFLLTAPAPVAFGKGVLDIHTLSIAGMVMLLGFQALSLGLFARLYSKQWLGIAGNGFFDYILEAFQLEQGLKIGSFIAVCGGVVLGWVVIRWALSGFGNLAEVRPVLVGTVLVLLGAQIIFDSFFLSFLKGEGK